MTCTTCHRVNPSGAAYCYNCGARLTPLPSAQQTPSVTGEPQPWTGGDAETAEQAAQRYLPAQAIPAGAYPNGSIGLGGPRAGAPAAGWRRNAGRVLAPLAPFLYLLGKLKFLAIFGKVGLTGVTMLISVVTYAWAWNLGWAAAIGFVVLLFIHEMGHWFMMRLKGVPASAPVFIPFLGAVIGMRGMPRSVKDEAEIGIAGPIAGTAGAFACLGLGALYGGHLWPVLGAIGLFLNLFNLLPVSPLDGGRIVAAISRWLWLVGLAGLVLLFVWWRNPFLLFIGLIGGVETVARFRGRYAPTARPGYYDMSRAGRITMGALYFGLIALITVALYTNPALTIA